MKNRNNRNFLIYSLLIIVTVIVYLVIHISFGAISKEIYQCNEGSRNNNIYTVKTGDSLEEIAKRFNISLDKLLEANNLKEDDVLYPGQEIVIPVDDGGSSTDKQPINNIITTKEEEEPIKIEKIKLSSNKITMSIGDKKKLYVMVEPYNASKSDLVWVSSDPSVAAVDKYGNIVALKEGTVTITVKTKDGSVSESCTIVVKKIPVEEIVLNPTTMSVKVNSSASIVAIIKPSNATVDELIWESSDPSVARVDNNGRVTGVKEGTATITARTPDGKVTAVCTVNIVSDTVPVTGIKLDSDKTSVKVGSSEQLLATIEPANATERDIIWSSSDPNVVKVDENGKITGVNPGTATITVKTKDGEYEATCVVTVEPIAVDKVTLFPDDLAVKIGSSATITAIIEPDNATDQELIWTSSDPSVATVDKNGKVTGVKEGTATITAKTKDGKVKSECKVTVEPIKVDEIKLNPTELSVKVGSSATITATVKPENATHKELIWSSSDPSVATVDQNGKVTGVSVGTATITAKTKDGEVKATCVVNVTTETIPITKIELDHDDISIKVGENEQLIATIEPENATERELTWTSSDPSVVTVDENGNITGVKPGTATITVTSKDGTVTDTCTVTVEEIPGDIEFIYDYDEGNYIYLINQFPIKDEIGKSLEGDKRTQDFKLKFNEKAVGVHYVITAEKLDGSDLKEQWTKLFLVNDDADVANCYRANGRIKSFNEYQNYNGKEDEKILYEGTITASEAARGYKDFTFRMWVSEDLKLVNSNYLSETKTFKARINVYAVGE